MNKKFFYAAGNIYASETDIGFCNTWFVMAFDSRHSRDEYVRNATDMATRAITKTEIRKYIRTPAPFTGLHLAIVNTMPWLSDLQPNGYLGSVEQASEEWDGKGTISAVSHGYIRRLWN